MWSAKMEEVNCRNCMCIWEATPYKFHGPTSPFTYTPSQWHWIGGWRINEVDVFLWEVYENSKNICPTKSHLESCMVYGYILNESFFFLCEFLGKYFVDGTQFWDEKRASDIIDGEKAQSNGVQQEIGK